MRKQIITGLLAMSVAVATIAGCGAKEPLQSDSSAFCEQVGSVDEPDASTDVDTSEDTPEAGTDPSGEQVSAGEDNASETDMDAIGRELFRYSVSLSFTVFQMFYCLLLLINSNFYILWPVNK